MTEVAIRVEGLSKRYRIGSRRAPYGRFSETLLHTLKAPLQRLARASTRGVLGEAIWALNDVSFDVGRGEVVGVIGKNGAGKSTLLKILSRITEPTQGHAEIVGRVGSLLEVGTGFHPELTGRENVYLNGTILGMRRVEIDARFDAIVDFAGVGAFIDTPVKRYSSGMSVRLAFSVAAHLETEILLMDEVLAVGDVAFQKKCLGKMGDVAREGRTVLFVSHNMGAITNLCGRSFLLASGELVLQGSTKDVVNEYLYGDQVTTHSCWEYSDASRAGDTLVIRRVCLCDEDGVPVPSASLATGLYVEVCYDILRAITGANVSVHLINGDGICVLSSTDIDENPEASTESRLPGKHQVRVHVPGEFLRPGRYTIGVGASIPRFKTLANVPNVISFDVIDTGSIEVQTGQGRQGVVAPILHWSIVEKPS